MNRSIYTTITGSERKLPFCMETVGWQQHQSPIRRPLGYPFYHWLQTISGVGELSLNGKDYTIAPDMGFLLFPHDPHEYHAVKDPWEVCWLTFNGAHIDNTMQSLGFTGSCVLTLSDSKNVEMLLQGIIAQAKAYDGLNNLELSAMVYRFLTYLLKYSSYEDNYSLQQYFVRLSPVLNYIKYRYMEEISLEQLASCMSVTPQYLCRLFKEAFGITPFTYLAQYRIKKAKELLIIDGSTKVKEISNRVGFADNSYFCSLFRRYEGMTPGIFRNTYGLSSNR